MGGKGLRNLAVVCLEKPSTDQLAALGGLSTGGARLLVLHVEPAACTAAAALAHADGGQLHLALAAAREMLPPFAGVLHAPVPAEEAAAAAAAVAAAQAAAQAAPAHTAAPTVAAAPVSAAQPAANEAAVRSMIVAALGALLGDPSARAVGGDEPLMSAGLTSTLAVQLTQRLEESLGRELPGTLVFDYPTISKMAAYLAAELAGPAGRAATPTPSAMPAPLGSAASSTAPWAAATAPRAAAPPAVMGEGHAQAAAVQLVMRQVGDLMGGSAAADVTADTPLMSAGLTSTLAVQLTQRLEEAVGSELPGTLVFDYPTGVEEAAWQSRGSVWSRDASVPGCGWCCWQLHEL